MNRPLTLVCFICGREFGTKSLIIHIKSCEKKWANQQELLDKKKRRPCPKAPKGFMELISRPNLTRKDIQNFNSGAFDTFMDQALVQCEFCGRKFNEKSLIPHQKACSTNPMIRKHYVSNQEKKAIGGSGGSGGQESFKKSQYPTSKMDQMQSANDVNLDLVPCEKCGRKFNSDRVAKHQKVCKESKKPKAQSTMSSVKPQTNSPYMANSGSGNTKPNLTKKKPATGSTGNGKDDPKWKKQHNQLVNAMKEMRKIKQFQANGGNLRDLPPPPPSQNPDYIQCKYCGRKYAPSVAQRHIPKCANIINKPGGIKASKIQDKYVGGTGVKKVQPAPYGSPQTQMGKSKPKQVMKGYADTKPSPLKPNTKTAWGNTSNLKKKF